MGCVWLAQAVPAVVPGGGYSSRTPPSCGTFRKGRRTWRRWSERSLRPGTSSWTWPTLPPPIWPRRGHLEELRARADAGDEKAAWRVAELLAARGDPDGAKQILRARADDGDSHAARELAELLAQRADLDGLRARVGAGDSHAAPPLVDLLIKQGRNEEAERLRRFGLNPDGSIASA